MFGLRLPELLIILAVLVLVFGANKIPQLGSALGDTVKGFKKALNARDEEPAAKGDAGAEQPADPAKSRTDKSA